VPFPTIQTENGKSALVHQVYPALEYRSNKKQYQTNQNLKGNSVMLHLITPDKL
jgi:hypothetical protein